MKPLGVGLTTALLLGLLWGLSACLQHPSADRRNRRATAHQPGTDATIAPDTAQDPAPEADTPALIGTLRSREHTIHLYVGRFTVEDSNGRTLAHVVSEHDFAKLLPGLSGEFKQMLAGGQPFADNRTHGNLSLDALSFGHAITRQRGSVTSDP